MTRRAIFLDRDGTLIEDPGYLNDPAKVRLLAGVGESLARLHRAGFLLIVVTNQSGIARGMITPAQYLAVARRLEAVTGEAGGLVHAQYFCPHLPEISGPCQCRKPGLLLFQQAISAWGIDPRSSWWVGDRMRDLVPGQELGGRPIFVAGNGGLEEERLAEEAGVARVADFAAATERILTAAPAWS